ncbi:MAG: hypothetical protein ACMUIE_08750 [Thermoplasmatota archaeon]
MYDNNSSSSGELPEGFEVVQGELIVKCYDCGIQPDLGSRACFDCVSGNMLPGFKGSIVLQGDKDRRYSEPITDLVSLHSSLRRSVEAFCAGEGSGLLLGRSNPGRKLKKEVGDLFKENPAELHGKMEKLLKVSKGLGGKWSKRDQAALRDILEKNGIMVRKMQGNL